MIKITSVLLFLVLVPVICYADQPYNGIVTFKDQDIKSIVRCPGMDFYDGCRVYVCWSVQKNLFNEDGQECNYRTLTIQETIKRSTGREDVKIIGVDTRHQLLFVTWKDESGT